MWIAVSIWLFVWPLLVSPKHAPTVHTIANVIEMSCALGWFGWWSERWSCVFLKTIDLHCLVLKELIIALVHPVYGSVTWHLKKNFFKKSLLELIYLQNKNFLWKLGWFRFKIFKILVQSLTCIWKYQVIWVSLKCSAETQPQCMSCKIVIDSCPFLQTPIMVRKQSAIYYEVWSLILPLH